ncbi:MAG: 4Fe-4S binding protein [bacterium]|nr:4Fe-4S binding protein [bacterium]
MKHSILKKIGVALVALSAAVFTLKVFGGLPWIGGFLLIALLLVAPAIGGVLLFYDRYFSRPAGIDNDDVYHNSSTKAGAIGILLGILLTSFYIVIYLGDKPWLHYQKDAPATVQVDASGKITGVSGPAADDLRRLCWQCPNKGDADGWWRDAEYKAILPYTGSYHKLGARTLPDAKGDRVQNGDEAQGEIENEISVNNIYLLRVAIDEQQPGAIQFFVTDSPHHFALRNVYSMLNPLARLITGKNADNWFFYGTLYTFAILLFGVRMIWKYRHNNYHIIRTISVMFFQLGFGYMIPNILVLFKQPGFYFSYWWPLKPEYFYPSTWAGYAADANSLGLYFVIFGALMSFVAVPVLTFLYGKRWYCSWVCGCGGLAETMGDPFRQLSDKSLKAWQAERWLIHGVLVIITVVTGLLWANSFSGGELLGSYSQAMSEAYGFYIGAIFSGVIGVGFYPIFGSRVWCRFGCPMAAILGMGQKFFSRFRITTNGAQCISCGNCSTYCEMGIDVRWYAQRGQNIIRSSCVGCGVCAAVCPRGVLRLENGPVDSIFTRYNDPQATVLN